MLELIPLAPSQVTRAFPASAELSEACAFALCHFPSAAAYTWGQTGEVRPWASVTKLATALAAWVAIERGQLDFDDPIPTGQALAAWGQAGDSAVRDAGRENWQEWENLPDLAGLTLADLLAHTTGLDFGQVRAAVRPYTKRVYSNVGMELAGIMLARATGLESGAAAVNELVLAPLGMKCRMPNGASVAYGLSGDLEDLLRLGFELARPTLISADLHAYVCAAYYPQGQVLGGILPGYGRQEDNAWGLGPEVRSTKNPHWIAGSFSPRSFGHFGQSGSFLFIDPEAQIGGAYLSRTNFGAENQNHWADLTAQMHNFALGQD